MAAKAAGSSARENEMANENEINNESCRRNGGVMARLMASASKQWQ